MHILQNIFVAVWTAFHLVPKFICNLLKSPGDGLDDDKPTRKWYVVRASKPSMLLLFGVSGCWLTIDSISQKKVGEASSVNKCSLMIVLKVRYFPNLSYTRNNWKLEFLLNVLFNQSLAYFSLVYAN